MSSFRNQAGVDLDLIFAGRVTDKTSNVNFRNTDSVDISNRYEKSNAQSPAALTNMRGPDGRDLNLWFTTDAAAGLSVNVSASDVSYNNGLSNTPFTRSMSTAAEAAASGGAGGYTYAWSITNSSGVTGATLSTTTGHYTTITATATINSPGTVTVRCVVTSGSNTASATRTVTFDYYNEV